MSRKFDRFMVQSGAARHVKFRRLNTTERHAFFLGVLSIAAQAPIRGCLLVGNLPAEAEDVAQEADVHVKFAESAMAKLREVGVIYHDTDLGCERVHDFDEWNPAPKTDATNAERQRRYRDRLKASRNGTVTPVTHANVTPPEVEGEGNKEERERSARAIIDDVVEILEQSSRLHIDRVGVENAIASWPGQDPLKAARSVVTWVTDPAFNGTNAARLLDSALSKQQLAAKQAKSVTPIRPRGGSQQASAEDFLRIARGEQ